MSEDGFVKLDTGKPCFNMLADFDNELGGINRCLEYGARKYERDNWKLGTSVEDMERNLNASIRHIFKHLKGESMDSESGLPHLHHALTDILFVAYHSRERGDDAK